jgi:hypothetical protein
MLAAAAVSSAAIAKVLAVIIACMGAGFALSATFMLERRLKALRFGHKVAAEVVRLAPPPAWPLGIQVVNNVPWVRYRLTSGQEREAMLAPPYPRRISLYFPVGKQLEVRYDPLRLDVVYQAGLFTLLAGPVIMLCSGMLCLVLFWSIWNGM